MLTTRASAASRTAGEGIRRAGAVAPARSGGDGSSGFVVTFANATEASRSLHAGAPTTAQLITAQLTTTAQLPTERLPTAAPTSTQDDIAAGHSAVAGGSRTVPVSGHPDGAGACRPAPPEVAALPAAAPGSADGKPAAGMPRLAAATGQWSSQRNDRDLRHPPQTVAAGAIGLAAFLLQGVVPPGPTAPGAPAAGSQTSAEPGSPPALGHPDDPVAGLSQGVRNDAPGPDSKAQVPSGGGVPGMPDSTAAATAANNANDTAPAAVAGTGGGQVSGLPLAAAVASAGNSGALALGLRSPAPSAPGGSSAAQGSVSPLPAPTAPPSRAGPQTSPLQFPSVREAPPATAAAQKAPAGAAAQPFGGVAVAPAPAQSAARSGDDDRFGAARPGAGATSVMPAAAASVVAPVSSPQAGTAGAGADAAGLAEQVAHHVVGALGAGQLDVVLRLHPPELGELNVRIQVAGHEVSAWFDSPLPLVQQALSQGMGQLQAGLANAGYNLNAAWVGGDAWTPRGRTAPLAPRPARIPGVAQTQPAHGTVSPVGAGVSLYV
jgi:hypothetical protein